jgi:hypothetical protein
MIVPSHCCTHSEHWQHFRSVFMFAAVGATETNKGTDWSSRIWGKKIPYEKNNVLAA